MTDQNFFRIRLRSQMCSSTTKSPQPKGPVDSVEIAAHAFACETGRRGIEIWFTDLRLDEHAKISWSYACVGPAPASAVGIRPGRFDELGILLRYAQRTGLQTSTNPTAERTRIWTGAPEGNPYLSESIEPLRPTCHGFRSTDRYRAANG